MNDLSSVWYPGEFYSCLAESIFKTGSVERIPESDGK